MCHKYMTVLTRSSLPFPLTQFNSIWHDLLNRIIYCQRQSIGGDLSESDRDHSRNFNENASFCDSITYIYMKDVKG